MSHSNAGTLQANNVSWKLARSGVHIDSAIEQTGNRHHEQSRVLSAAGAREISLVTGEINTADNQPAAALKH
jgi:hypothetical protein